MLFPQGGVILDRGQIFTMDSVDQAFRLDREGQEI